MQLSELLSQTGDSAAYSWQDVVDLAQTLVQEAADAGRTVASAESCTGGLVSGAITAVSGSSAMFLGGVASYAFSAKTGVLGVLQATLDSVGAVSEECASEMADGARKLFVADVAVSTTGIAGPSGAVPGKPVGTVCFGISTDAGTQSVRRLFSGDRDTVRLKSVAFALELIRGAIAETGNLAF